MQTNTSEYSTLVFADMQHPLLHSSLVKLTVTVYELKWPSCSLLSMFNIDILNCHTSCTKLLSTSVDGEM